MVDSPCEWLWSSWHNMVGSKASPHWLATDALLRLFASNRKQAISEYVQFVEEGRNATIWDDLQHQVFLGDLE